MEAVSGRGWAMDASPCAPSDTCLGLGLGAHLPKWVTPQGAPLHTKPPPHSPASVLSGVRVVLIRSGV